LDEVCNLPLPSQAKLLRVLQEKALYRVGGTQPIRIDARVLAASNDDLEALVDQGSFRRDLYFRLNEFVIRVPPLRQRREDIPYLAKHFMDITNIELSKQVKGMARSALEAMLAYDWPGNVRQLRSVIRRGVLLAEDSVTAQHLALNRPPVMPLPMTLADESDQESGSLREIVKRHTASLERGIIARALRQMGGNKTRTARLLEIDFKTLHSKLKEYEIESKGVTSWPRKAVEPEREFPPAGSASA
jgi:two-component system nitrogen regulation response regulator GlnG